VNRISSLVVAGLDPAIHAALSNYRRSAWMRGSSRRMTTKRMFNLTGFALVNEFRELIMERIRIKAGRFQFVARFEAERAPKTCAKFRSMLPYKERIIHVRWSGEACWIPLGDLDLGLGCENQTSYPAPGEIILYPGGISETEILLAYGGVRFASKVGQLAGNHFLTVIEGADQLRALGERVLWQGAQDILFEAC
jgi:Protein of unknown function (DUF3830)